MGWVVCFEAGVWVRCHFFRMGWNVNVKGGTFNAQRSTPNVRGGGGDCGVNEELRMQNEEKIDGDQGEVF